MRKVVLGVGISLDGYIARPDGAVDFLFMPRDYSMAEFMASIDTLIMGRMTYEVGLKMGGTFNDPQQTVYVLSRTLPTGERDGVKFVNESPAKLVARIRERQGKDIWLMGGGVTASDYLAADLVDEIYLGIVPVAIGDGLPLFVKGFPQREFALTECKEYSKGLVSLKYRRVRSKKK